MINWANEQRCPVLALDTPSGVDSTTGKVFQPAIQATATLTLAMPKVGMQEEKAAKQVGELYLADISVPPELYAEDSLKLKVGALFANSEIVRLK